MRTTLCLLALCACLSAQASVLVTQGGTPMSPNIDSGKETVSQVVNPPGILLGVVVWHKWYDSNGKLRKAEINHSWPGVPYDPSYIIFTPYKRGHGVEEWIEIIYTYDSDDELPILVPAVRLFN